MSSSFEDAKKVTLSGREPEPVGFDSATQEVVLPAGAPAPIDEKTGMHRDYWILNDEERARGFVRPVRTSYVHVGVRPKYPLRFLEGAELAKNVKWGYVAEERYPVGSLEKERGLYGRMWTAAQLKSGCGAATTMNVKLAETYAADPGFYWATFCATCRAHFPVGAHGEFVWADVVPEERVGT